MEIKLDAQRLSAELVMADAAEGDTLRKTLASVSAEKEAMEQQLQIMSTLDELKDCADANTESMAGSRSNQDEVSQPLIFCLRQCLIEPCSDLTWCIRTFYWPHLLQEQSIKQS
jgi:hypothetical protein